MCESGSESTGKTEVEALVAAVARLQSRPTQERTLVEVTDEIRVLRGAMDRLDLVLARLIGGTVQRFEEWEGLDEFGPVHWLRHEVHMSYRQADDAVCVGEMAEQLPQSVAALQAGRIGFAHLGLLASVAQEAALSETGAGFDERPLLRQAERHTVTQFRRDCAHARHAADAEAFLRDEVRAVEERHLELQPGPGGLFLSGWPATPPSAESF